MLILPGFIDFVIKTLNSLNILLFNYICKKIKKYNLKIFFEYSSKIINFKF